VQLIGLPVVQVERFFQNAELVARSPVTAATLELESIKSPVSGFAHAEAQDRYGELSFPKR
jgi:hypothetical protein